MATISEIEEIRATAKIKLGYIKNINHNEYERLLDCVMRSISRDLQLELPEPASGYHPLE
jgi:hypothetical protein